MPSTPKDPQDEAPVDAETSPDEQEPSPPAPVTPEPEAPPTPPTFEAPTASPEAPEPEPLPTPPTVEAPPVTPPEPTTPPDAVAGQHAAPRPYPPEAPTDLPTRVSARPQGYEGALARERVTEFQPAGPSTDPQPTAHLTEDLPPAPPTAQPTPFAPVGAPTAPLVAPGVAPVPIAEPAPVPLVDTRRRRDIPEPPARPGFGSHLLAAVLGLILTPFALLLTGVGTYRLADATSDTNFTALSVLLGGVALLVVIALLGVWSAALPIAGGLVWGVGLGAAYLAIPDAVDDAVEAAWPETVPDALEQFADVATDGHLVVVGALLVAAGVATAIARGRARRRAERVAAAERARADAARADTTLSNGF